VELPHVLEWDHDLQVELLARAGVDELDRPSGARHEAPDLLERTLRRGEADALERAAHEPLQALERQREVRSALRAGDRVHLVDDHRLDAPERLPRLRGEQEEEGLRSRDEDVRRRLQHAPPLVGRSVAGAHGDGELGAEPGQRAPEVPLDVVVQCLERRHVEQAQALAGGRVQPVDAVQERGERLAGSGRRLDEHVPPAGDRRPAVRLRRGGRGERALEPVPGLRREEVQRAHAR
jgi:hypothetical protein